MTSFRRGSSSELRRVSSFKDAARSDRANLDDPMALEERHYSVQQLADAWNLSGDFVRRLFRDEPGVTEWVQQARGKRRYRVLRIPESVAARVYRRALAAADSDHPPAAF